MDPEQTAPIGVARSGSTPFATEASQTFQQTRKADNFVAIGALKVKDPLNDLRLPYSTQRYSFNVEEQCQIQIS